MARCKLLVLITLLAFTNSCFSQAVPATQENIPFLVTFGPSASPTWGDDDNCQIFFISVPEIFTAPFFIRVFDADNGGQHDEQKSDFNSRTKFSLYGGEVYSKIDEENKDPIGNFRQGNQLYSRVVGSSESLDNQWMNIGPINPSEGQLMPELGGRVFKFIIQGLSGDDGNLYKFFVSTSESENREIEGGNVFTFEYAFRLNQKTGAISHIYPYVDVNTIAVRQSNFDLDDDAYIKVVSMSNPGFKVASSLDGQWILSEHPTEEVDKNTCLDVQFIKTGSVGNNNVVFFITNQYGKAMPFHSIPIGVIPKRKIGIKPK